VLQEAGTVLHLARSGRLILKASPPAVREGSILVDEKGRRTGKVLELIGPVESPFLSVQPFTDRIERISDTKLYLGEDEPRSLGRPRFGNKRDSRDSRSRGKGNQSRSSYPRSERRSNRS
jgi:RNA-binding protein